MEIKEFDYELVRSKRRTVAIYIKPDGRIVVRAPMKASVKSIEGFLLQKADWIRKTRIQLSQREKEKECVVLSREDQIFWRKRARVFLTERSEYYAREMGVVFRQIRINGARTRWGSCSAKGDINFTYLLMFAPEETIDYVVVHELAHLREMNHSARFWAVVAEVMPDYADRRKRLKEFQRAVSIEEEGRSVR